MHELEIKLDMLKKIVAFMHGYARRYCDGRMSCVTSQFNEYTKQLLELGVELQVGADGTIWARDGMGRAYDGLTRDQAEQGEAVDMAHYRIIYEHSGNVTEAEKAAIRLERALDLDTRPDYAIQANDRVERIYRGLHTKEFLEEKLRESIKSVLVNQSLVGVTVKNV